MTMLSYCTNVHPAEDVPGIVGQFDRYAAPVMAKVGEPIGLGLWLPAEVAAQLAADPAALVRFRRELDARELRVVTLNAFPYKGFHQPVVKHEVYRPRWTDQVRLRYTENCATVLAGLLADNVDSGSISTLPLGWRTPWSDRDDRSATESLARLTDHLRELAARDGRPIRIAVEPEPGCVLDTVADAVDWLAGRVDPEFIGVCLDTCHLAVSFADPATAVAYVRAAGLHVYKAQISAAVHASDPADPATAKALAEFAEPRYLHQVRRLGPDGVVAAADDLPDAARELCGDGPWRVHCHVPLHAELAAPLSSTTSVIDQALAALAGHEVVPHLEVETYTWQVLPERYRQDLVSGIAAELRWARDRIAGGRR